MTERGRFGVHMGNTTIMLSTLKVYSYLMHFAQYPIQFPYFQGETAEIVPNKAGGRYTYAYLIAAENESQYITDSVAKHSLPGNEAASVINNYQFLNEDLTDEEIDAAVSNCLCKILKNPLNYELSSNFEALPSATPHSITALMLKNTHGKIEWEHNCDVRDLNMDIFFYREC